MKKNSIFGLVMVLVAAFFLTACFGGGSDDEEVDKPGASAKNLTCIMPSEVASVGTNETKVILDYTSAEDSVTMYTKIQSIEFTEEYSAFVDITKSDWESACAANEQQFDECKVTVEGRKVVMTGTTKIAKDRVEEINENVYATTKRSEAKTNYENAGYTCK